MLKHCIIGMMISFSCTALAGNVITKEQQQAKTPERVLERLKEGNQRFVSGHMKNRNITAKVAASASGQHPIAVILNCIDSRTPPELVFDQTIGDVFAIRIAGNVLNNDILGSMEFGTKLSGAKLIAVIGHTNCGAIRGACQGAELGHLTGLLHKIQPAVTEAKNASDNQQCSDTAFINKIAEDNVRLVMKQILAESPVIKKLVDDGQVKLVGGVQDLATGKVTFF